MALAQSFGRYLSTAAYFAEESCCRGATVMSKWLEVSGAPLSGASLTRIYWELLAEDSPDVVAPRPPVSMARR